ncbi:MAG: class I SAM-dependent rRNA methyltransferase, partial [Proteobacteria bacterium]|nr:class I SAM-dependent rRNA methyltransferase [Pseudomonadota bacterium]
MGIIQKDLENPVRLRLKRDRTRVLKQGYPWIYRDWLEELPPARAGSRALVKDRDGSLVAFGFYDSRCPIAVRVCAVEQERLGEDLFEDRLQAAKELRRTLFSAETTGYRLLNGEGDGVPGLVCDLYGSQAVIKLDGDGPAGFWDVQGIAQWLAREVRVTSVFLKHRAGGEERGETIYGAEPKGHIGFLENGIRFKADIVRGQKTGFFFDQRDNRARIRAWSNRRSVLNLFSYTGGFSVYAGKGGASLVTTVDLAKPAI